MGEENDEKGNVKTTPILISDRARETKKHTCMGNEKSRMSLYER